MKISYKWLKSYLNIDLSPERVAELLTGCGLEVESLEKIESVLREDVSNFQMYIRDEIVFEAYFLIYRIESHYYGFVDQEHVQSPEFVGKIQTSKLLQLLKIYQKLDPNLC